MSGLRFVDVCAGAGGSASGPAHAGFEPVPLLDKEPVAYDTLRRNRPAWQVPESDLPGFTHSRQQEIYDIDPLSGGLPHVKPGAAVGRTEIETQLRLLETTVCPAYAGQPRALVIENVPEPVCAPDLEPIRDPIHGELNHLGHRFRRFLLNAADFGVSQDREHGPGVALAKQAFDVFRPPEPTVREHPSVGRAPRRSISIGGWRDADRWAARTPSVAPTSVGGSDRRGNVDLGPTGTKKVWLRTGVGGGTVTDRGRRIGHASTPPMARALGPAVRAAWAAPAASVAGYTSTP
ncbi:DNA cytosine methyltransferase [Streptomyces celluloflavus]